MAFSRIDGLTWQLRYYGSVLRLLRLDVDGLLLENFPSALLLLFTDPGVPFSSLVLLNTDSQPVPQL